MPAGKSKFDALFKPFEPIRERVDVFLSAHASDDPLYLTNRTWQQKVKGAAMIGIPAVALLALVTAAASGVFRTHKIDTYNHTAVLEPAAALPQKHIADPGYTSSDLDVMDLRIARDSHPPSVTGLVRNNTGQTVASAQVTYYLADDAGSLVASDTTDVRDILPHASVAFRRALKSANAQYVLVRDVHPN
jgi:hypothetical protein